MRPHNQNPALEKRQNHTRYAKAVIGGSLHQIESAFYFGLGLYVHMTRCKKLAEHEGMSWLWCCRNEGHRVRRRCLRETCP